MINISKKELEKRRWDLKRIRERVRLEEARAHKLSMVIISAGGVLVIILGILSYLQIHTGL